MVAASSKDTGALPDGWRMVRLGEMAKVNPRRTRLNVRDDTQVRFLPMAAVGEQLSGVIEYHERPFSEVSSGYTYFEQGDVIFAKITPCLQNGKHALLSDLPNGFGFGSTEFHVVRADSLLDPRHLFRALTQPHNIRECVNSFTGTAGQQRVQPDVLESLPILLPPLAEQRAIAGVLDSIDEAIERTEAAITATERLRDALLHELLTRGIPGWHTEWKDAPGLGTIPADWEVMRLGEVADVIMGQSPDGIYSNHNGQGVPLLNGPTEYGSNYPTPVQWTTDPKKMSNVGDILFCVRGATAGRMNWANMDYAIGRGVAAFRHLSGLPYQPFLRAIVDFKLPKLLTSVTGSTFPNLSYEQITQLRVPGVPLSEQQAISAMLEAVDMAIEQARQEHGGLLLLKASAADALLSGSVRVGMRN